MKCGQKKRGWVLVHPLTIFLFNIGLNGYSLYQI